MKSENPSPDSRPHTLVERALIDAVLKAASPLSFRGEIDQRLGRATGATRLLVHIFSNADFHDFELSPADLHDTAAMIANELEIVFELQNWLFEDARNGFAEEKTP